MQTIEQKQQKASSIASQLHGFLQDAMGDCASGMLEFPDNDKWGRKIKKARKEGVRDLHGWLADELYNDTGILEDLLGDRLCDETSGDTELRNLVLDKMKERAHPALVKACNNLRRDK